MSDASDKSRDDANDGEESPGVIGGERLAAARREQKISVLEIAKELHLDEPKVRALERNDFDVIGAPVFAKGHMRKYAQLVGVDEADVMADYYQLNRTAGAPPLVSTRRKPRREMAPGPWIIVIVVLILVATAYWWFTSAPVRAPVDEPPAESAAPDVEMENEREPTPAVDSVGDELEPALAGSDADDTAVLESADAPAVAAPAGVPDDPELGDGQLRILLTYSGDCWTEITDANGRRLFFGLGTDGRTVELSGEAPFNVLFGNADSVSVTVNGAERAISPGERRGRTARLTIAGS